MLHITVNGKSISIDAPRLDQTLETLGHRCKHFAVAVNGDFVARDRYASYTLKAGDALEVLSPMQGG